MFSNSLLKFSIVAQLTFVFREILFLVTSLCYFCFFQVPIFVIKELRSFIYGGQNLNYWSVLHRVLHGLLWRDTSLRNFCISSLTRFIIFCLLDNFHSHRKPVLSCLIWNFAHFRHVNIYCFKHLEIYASLDLLIEWKLSLCSVIISTLSRGLYYSLYTYKTYYTYTIEFNIY